MKQLTEELQGLYEAAQVDEKPYRRLLTDADLDFLVAVKEYLPRIRAALMAADELAALLDEVLYVVGGANVADDYEKRVYAALNSYKEKVQE